MPAGDDSSSLIPRTRRGAQTRGRLLRAAEEAFGSRGYHRAGISDITRAAGVAQGTFYSYFRNKEDVLRELVRNMGRDVRAHLATEVVGARTRLEAEALGLRAFLAYVAGHPWMYRVLQEAQFVDEGIYREYYEAFGESYLRLLSSAQGAGEIRPGNNAVRVWALMGMAHFLGLRYGLWQRDVPLDRVVDTVRDLLQHGLMDGEKSG